MAAASVDDAEALRLQGNDAFTRGDYPEAARLYSASLASRPSAAALSNRSAAHLRLGLRAQALADADACAALDPSFARARLRVAQALQGLHDAAAASEAESALAELLRHTPASDPIIRELRAIADAPERASIFHTAGGATPQPPTGNVSAATGASMEAAYIGFLSADPRRLVALMTLSWGLQHGPQPLPGGMAPPGPVAVHMLAPASTPAVVRVSFMPLCMLQTLAAHPQYKAASSPEEVAATLDQIDKLSRVRCRKEPLPQPHKSNVSAPRVYIECFLVALSVLG